jgi:hypothetical protein
MACQPRHIEKLAAAVQEAAKIYTQLLLQFFGDRLLGITFYGAVVEEDYDLDQDRARSVIVLDRIRLEALRDLARHGSHLGRMGLVAPVVMTPDYIRDSLDTFPLELLEIQTRNVTILGDNPFCELRFDREHVRLQCERELKTLMIGLRQGLLAAGGRESLLGRLEHPAAETLLRVLRGLLWLDQADLALPAQELAVAAERRLGMELPGARAAIAREGSLGWQAYTQLYADLEVLRERVDAWES